MYVRRAQLSYSLGVPMYIHRGKLKSGLGKALIENHVHLTNTYVLHESPSVVIVWLLKRGLVIRVVFLLGRRRSCHMFLLACDRCCHVENVFFCVAVM